MDDQNWMHIDNERIHDRVCDGWKLWNVYRKQWEKDDNSLFGGDALTEP